MKTFLVTGCAGFIGTNLCLYLLKLNYRVIGVDNLSTGSKTNVSLLENFPNFNFIKTDICNLETESNLDCIINLACIASPKQYDKRKLDVIHTNSYGIENLCRLALENNCRLIHTSTSEIYGDSLENPQKESYNGNVSTTGPRACYAEGKRFAETILSVYKSEKNLDIVIVRLFNIYGPYMNEGDGRVIPNFIKQALSNTPLTVHGDGTQTRSFCYIDDITDVFLQIANNSIVFEHPVNIGNPEEVQMNYLAQQVLDVCNSASSITYLDIPKDDPKVRCPDCTYIEQKLGWKPSISLREGLTRLYIGIKNGYNN